MSQHQSPLPSRMEDNMRVQRIVYELSAKQKTQFTMEDKAKQMLLDYANELTISLLESANLLTKHRGCRQISVEDINMILSKFERFPDFILSYFL